MGIFDNTKPVAFNPKAFQFWSSTEVRPKRIYEAILIFPDLIFGGDGLQNIEPYLIRSFDRPGYSRIETTTAEYQLETGDFQRIEYPTQGYNTKPLKVTLIDVVNHNKGANTAAAIQASLTLQGKTAQYYKKMSSIKQDGFAKPEKIQMAMKDNPSRFNIIEFDNKGQSVGQWIIERPVLTSVNFSSINYQGSGIGTIDLGFNYQDFSYESTWGDKLLESRLERVGLSDKAKKPISTILGNAAKGFAEKMKIGDANFQKSLSPEKK